MRKLGLLLWMLAFTAVGAQAQNIIEESGTYSAGTGKGDVFIKTPKIEALIGAGTSFYGRTESVEGSRIQNTGVCR